MHNPELQLMLYGSDLGSLDPEIEYPGVSIKKVQRVENPNYLFLYLHIAPQTKAGTIELKLLKEGREQLTHAYELREREKGSAQRKGFNSSDVIYLVTPDRFANGDTGNDRIPGMADTLDRGDDYARHGGDLQGIIEHLDYIEKMGFTALWLNPVLENAMDEQSYHGYATTDFYKVDPRYGSNRLYKKLGEEAEKRGIKLIMDIITNHAGSGHWWMQDPPSSDWLHYQDNFRLTNHRRRTLHDPYASRIDRERFVRGWFVPSMPDLNQANPLMADYLIYNSLWWIEYAGLEGIRHDTHPYAGPEFLERWTCRIMEEYPNFNIVGEEWALEPAVLAKWQRGNSLPVDFGSCLPSLMDFPIQSSLIEALTGEISWDSGFIRLYETLTYDYLYPEPFNMVVFPDNHDMDRFYRQVGNDYELFKMGLAYLLTIRGIPQIYYGTEILMSNDKGGSHGNIRSDFPGGWETDRSNAFTGRGLSNKQREAQRFIRKLLNWRKDKPVIHTGKLMQYAPRHDGVYVYFRYNDDKTVMVIFNKAEKEKTLDPGYFHERLEGYAKGTDVITGQSHSLTHGKMQIPSRSVLLLELK